MFWALWAHLRVGLLGVQLVDEAPHQNIRHSELRNILFTCMSNVQLTTVGGEATRKKRLIGDDARRVEVGD
jgi:hypothetical protein